MTFYCLENLNLGQRNVKLLQQNIHVEVMLETSSPSYQVAKIPVIIKIIGNYYPSTEHNNLKIDMKFHNIIYS